MQSSKLQQTTELVRIRDAQGQQRCFANGQRISPERYDQIWSRARVIDCLVTRRRLSCWVHHASARS
jgi:hypothetical protein